MIGVKLTENSVDMYFHWLIVILSFYFQIMQNKHIASITFCQPKQSSSSSGRDGATVSWPTRSQCAISNVSSPFKHDIHAYSWIFCHLFLRSSFNSHTPVAVCYIYINIQLYGCILFHCITIYGIPMLSFWLKNSPRSFLYRNVEMGTWADSPSWHRSQTGSFSIQIIHQKGTRIFAGSGFGQERDICF